MDGIYDVRRLQLSTTDRLILKGLATGLLTKEIALQIHKSQGTVDLHVRILRARFGAQSRAQLIYEAVRAGVIEQPAVSQGSFRPTLRGLDRQTLDDEW